jgi:hypothetical protein
MLTLTAASAAGNAAAAAANAGGGGSNGAASMAKDEVRSMKMTNFSIAAIMNSSSKVAAAAAAVAAGAEAASRNPFLERPIPFKMEPFSPLGKKIYKICGQNKFVQRLYTFFSVCKLM